MNKGNAKSKDLINVGDVKNIVADIGGYLREMEEKTQAQYE